MKRAFIIALCLILAVGCSKENDGGSLSGTKWWTDWSGDYMELQFNGPVSCQVAIVTPEGVVKGDIHHGSYSLSSDHVTFDLEIPERDYYVRTGRQFKEGSINGNYMTVIMEWGGTEVPPYTFTKK